MRRTSWLGRLLAPFSPATRRWTATPFRPRVERLECRRLLATLLVSPSGLFSSTPTPFLTIQSAVDAATPGDSILVSPGTYQEQVLITKDSLTLTSASPLAAIIKGPQNDVLVGNTAIVDIQGSTNVVVDGFIITGTGPSSIPLAGLCFGIYVENSSTITIQNNYVTQISDNPSSASLSGVGIQVGLAPGSASALGLAVTTGSAQITNNTIDGYQRSGIVVDNVGSLASVQGNVVTGSASDLIVQNGIEVSNGATGVVQSNTVTGNLFVLNHGTEATGILLFNPGPGVQVLGNLVVFNDAGIVVQGAVNPVISGNIINLSTYDGIQLTSGTTGAQVASNLSTENGLNGIYVNANNNTITDNTTTFNSRDGIQMIQAFGNVVQGNTAFENARYGISQFLSAGQSNVLSDNSVYTNSIGDFFV